MFYAAITEVLAPDCIIDYGVHKETAATARHGLKKLRKDMPNTALHAPQ